MFSLSSICDVFPMSVYLSVDFHQTFASSESWDKDELNEFWGQR